jgi:raffinose/stachyose/melibiose transport system permease protein
LVLPALTLYTALVAVPIGVSVLYSLSKWHGLNVDLLTFNHFGFYKQIVHDSVVATGLLNNLRAFVLYAVFTIPVALVLAYIIARYARAVSFFRSVYFIPAITSTALLALIFRFFFTTDAGLDGLLRALGLGGLVHPWMAQPGLAAWVVNVPQAWMSVGFWVVIFIAAIAGIDRQLFEAAAVDGASAWQQLRDVAIPALRPVLIFAYLLNVVFAIQAGDFQIIMPPNGPGEPLNSTHTLASYTYSLIANTGRTPTNWGYASALSVLLFAMCSIGAALVLLVARRRAKEA